MARWDAYDIRVDTIFELENARYFVEFFAYHAQRSAELHQTNAQFHRGQLAYAFVNASAGLARIARDIENNGQAEAEPDNFKRCGYICFWLRRAKPFVYAKAVGNFPGGSRERAAQDLFCRYHNELFAFDLMFRVCAAYEGAARNDVSIATASLEATYLNDVCVSLKNNSVSPQSMYLIYRSLFETVG